MKKVEVSNTANNVIVSAFPDPEEAGVRLVEISLEPQQARALAELLVRAAGRVEGLEDKNPYVHRAELRDFGT